MARSKEEVLADIKRNKEEAARLAQELIVVTAEAFLVVYDVRNDANNKIIDIPPNRWIHGKVLSISSYFSRDARVMFCAYDVVRDERTMTARFSTIHEVPVDGGKVMRFDDNVSLRAFTSRSQAEACLELWIRTAGMSEYAQ